jgi:GNAT superfamily N-acetyltransferase
MALHVRQATLADLDDLVALFDGYRTFYGQKPDEDLARLFLLGRFRHLQSVIFIARFNEQAIGFVQLFPSFSSGKAARTFILNDLFVAAEARGRGAGKALLSAVADYGKAAGAVRLTLSTAHDNVAAQSLYEGAGWSRETTFVQYNLPLD